MTADPALEFARQSLMSYACLQWAGYEPAAHHHLIAQYLEKVERGEIKRLIIQSPPRSGKSLIVSTYFPAWYMGKNPDKRVVCASYGQELASDFGRAVRNQFSDVLFQKIFPGVRLAEDSAASDKFELSAPHRGGYVAVGVGGALTGRGAHCFVGGVKILTDRGAIAIESLGFCSHQDIRLNKFHEPVRALSCDLNTGQLGYQEIEAFMSRAGQDIYKVTTVQNREIELTGDHPVFVKEKGYILASQLKNGDALWCAVEAQGLPISVEDNVKSVVKSRDSAIVYDIQVKNNHNLFANGLLCHNCLIIDDPQKGREDSDSESHQRKLKDWYTSVAYTRLMDEGAIILCMTRWNVNDLAGWVIKEHKHDNWVVLNLPAINDKGEALWPERFPLRVLEGIKKTLPSRDWEALYQQKPFAEEGGIYKRDWWRKWPENKPAPECDFLIQSWDTAFSDADRKKSSYSSCVTLGVFNRPDDDFSNIFLVDAWKKRMEYPELRKEVQKQYREHRPDKVIIEKKASGMSLLQDLRRTDVPVSPYLPEKDKVTRAYAASSLLENGRIYYPDRRWARDFIDALAQFPTPEVDDLSDAFAQAIIWLQNAHVILHSEDAERRAREDEEEDDIYADEDLPSNVRRMKPKKRRAAYG